MARPFGRGHGGIAGLFALLTEYGEAVEADLRRFYACDLPSALTGAVTWRQLIGWLRQLPDDAATVRAVAEAPEWTLTNHLLAALLDTLAWANYQRSGGKGTPPSPVPRPGVTTQNRRHHGRTDLSREEALAILRPQREDGESPAPAE